MQDERRQAERVSRFGAAVNIVLTAAVLAWFGFFPRYVGYLRSLSWPPEVVPVLLPAFGLYLPALAAWWLALIVLNTAHLALGRWVALTTLADALTRTYGLLVLAWMAAGPAFLTPAWLATASRWVLACSSLAHMLGLLLDAGRWLGRMASPQG